MTNKDGITGTLMSVDTTKKELTLEENVAFEAEPAVDYKSYSYDLSDALGRRAYPQSGGGACGGDVGGWSG